MTRINIQFTLFSAFYTPLISTMSGGFLKAEGLNPHWTISPTGVSALAALEHGSVHIVQSALSQGLGPLNNIICGDYFAVPCPDFGFPGDLRAFTENMMNEGRRLWMRDG